jgi:tRNA threonylcarbamoyl adenosine modification protein YeaZ
MRLLSIDTSTDCLSIAVTDEGAVLGRFHREVGRRHSELLIPAIDKVLKRCKIKLKDLDGFCVGIGPGSFTGLRIGVATIKGLSYSLNKPIVVVPTMDAIAYNAVKYRGVICPVLDAKKNKIYACFYSSNGKSLKRISKYLLVTVEELKNKNAGKDALFLGDGVKLLKEVSDTYFSAPWHPKAETIAKMGLEYFKNRKFTSAEDLEPMYIYSRECDVTGR